jgi:hypothetical protein
MYHWSLPSPPQCFESIVHLTKIRSASDGSVFHCQGFQGWLIAKLDNEVLIQGFGTTDGLVEDVSSYRAYIWGSISTSTVFNLIRKVHGFSPPTVKHICDNQSAISATCKYENISVFENTKPNSDVAKVARNSISDLQLHSNVKSYWLEGHADKRGPPFSPQVELNIPTDGLSGKAQPSFRLT